MNKEDDKREVLEGEIERLTFSSEQTGFSVLRLRTNNNERVTVVGNLVSVSPGERLRIQGTWMTHPRFGKQFRAEQYTSIQPTSEEAMKKYLESGLIRGIGPVMAERIIEHFGVQALEIIDNDIERLKEVQGIGEKRIRMIRDAWQAQRCIKEIMLFLVGHGIGISHATKIYKKYGDQSISILRANPYRLAEDIHGIGFLTADRIAGNLGVEKDSACRIRAGLLHVLTVSGEEGNTFCPYRTLLEEGEKLLHVGRDFLLPAVAELFEEKKIVIEDRNEDIENFEEDKKAVYLPYLYSAEVGIARGFARLLTNRGKESLKIRQENIEEAEHAMGIRFNRGQREAIVASATEKVLVITGGPGTGKSTLVRAIIHGFKKTRRRVLLSAPTGRAAKRLSEITGEEAKTIHRLLEFNPQKMEFARNSDRPLECDLLIVDEASMIDTLLLFYLVRAVPLEAALILVGDVDQLPSVGPGNVLKDLIGSGKISVITLDEIFRQASLSLIVQNAHRVKQGDFLVLPKVPKGEKGDFYFIRERDPERIVAIILELVSKRIPESFGFRPETDIQVLIPLYRGVVGVDNLNLRMQECLNPCGESFQANGKNLRVGDRVMQMRNNYDKEVFNGDIGTISFFNSVTKEFLVDFYGTKVRYEYDEANELDLAYAITVHKSQGSEYPAVILSLVPQHYVLLQRNLLYTALTRARNLAVIVGSERAIASAVRNDSVARRYTGLKWRIAAL
jgi:exodeoxyribonuclease V alpha subunit